MTPSIPENLAAVGKRIRDCERSNARLAGSVRLIAVSKTHPVASILVAHAAGQLEFGENKVQEALDKMQHLALLPLIWHFIGPIQSNKTKAIATHFDWVHSVDRSSIAQRLHEQRPQEHGPLKVLLQVNISGEASKAGVSLEEVPALAAAVTTLSNLKLCGLMTIPAPESDPALQQAAFTQLATAATHLRALGYADCTELSMGMSQDMEAAIAAGATMVRIGTDLFGPRPRSKGSE